MILTEACEWLCNLCRPKSEIDPEREKRTSDIGLFQYGYAYALSASELSSAQVRVGHSEAPVWFLYSHAIELYLKSFLRMKGVSAQELGSWKYGHDTKKLAKKAIRLGLDLSESQKQEIFLLRGAIRDRYIETGARTVLTTEARHALCVHLHSEIGLAIYANAGIKRSLPPLN